MKSGTAVLRIIGFAVGAAIMYWAWTLYREGAGAGAATVVCLEGALIAGGIIFERRRYQPTITNPRANWTVTNEKFVDPGTGKLMQVIFDPKTGERDYIELPSTKA